jgi:hypothetical protein
MPSSRIWERGATALSCFRGLILGRRSYQQRQAPFSPEDPQGLVKLKPTAPECNVLQPRRLNAEYQDGPHNVPTLHRPPGTSSFPSERRAGFCTELPSAGAQWNEAEVRWQVDGKPAARPAWITRPDDNEIANNQKINTPPPSPLEYAASLCSRSLRNFRGLNPY